jgi:hypothetical protein
MSVQVNAAFVQSYSTNVMMLLQQQGSRLRDSVMQQQLVGKAATVAEQFGNVTPVKNQGRHSDTPIISTPQDKRWIYPQDYDWADLIDNQDKLRMLIDPMSPYATAGAWAMGRAIDDEIIGAFFSNANTGENGTTATTFPAGQVVANTVGATAATGLNVAKLRFAKKLLLQAEVDIDHVPLYVAINAVQHDNMLNEAQAVSLDYTNKPVLVDGRITAFMGFNFIHSERTFGSPSCTQTGTVAGTYRIPAWAKTGVVLGMWNDVSSSVDKRVDKRNSWQVYVTGTFGAARLEEKQVVEIDSV